MIHRNLPIAAFLVSQSILAQFNNPLAIPPALDVDTFQLVVGQHQHQFYPGVNTTTFGVNGPYLGPTLIMHQGDTARFRVTNELTQVTNMHWHGMHVPGVVDGGPPREILPGDHWDLKYEVANPAGTYWYHPHPHMITGAQATKGIAGLIIVNDEEEADLELPRTYGVDDIPIVIQDRYFLPNGNFAVAPYGDSVLVNGTPHAYLECPAQVVRLRMLNGSNARIYPVGFEDGQEFQVIANDGGLLNAPVDRDRIWLSNGERVEILVDLSGLEGDSLLLMSYGSELPQTVPGSNNILWESSSLNGVDFPLLRIRVTAPTASPITSIPATLGSSVPIPENQAGGTRIKTLTGSGMVGMGMFMINGQMFDLDVVNDTVLLGSTEIWVFQNNSNMAHPMHVHGVSFFVLDRDGIPPAPEEAGAKDVVLVDAGETVRVIMEFNHLTDDWPYMYHCHNLMHEDNMMMLQYIVIDQNVGITEPTIATDLQVYPNPGNSFINFRSSFPVDNIQIMDQTGRVVHQSRGSDQYIGTLDVSSLGSGTYILQIRSGSALVRKIFVHQ